MFVLAVFFVSLVLSNKDTSSANKECVVEENSQVFLFLITLGIFFY